MLSVDVLTSIGPTTALIRFAGVDDELLPCLRIYQEILQSYEARGVSSAIDPTDKENPEDSHREQYLSVGRDALRIVISQLISHGRPPPTTILDFPSGSGRVTRHFRAAFPDARIAACDLYESHVDFCVVEFGAEALYSKEDLDAVDVEPEWDVVFVGSLLTHLPIQQARKALRLAHRSLSPDGIALVTLEGRRSIEIQKRFVKITQDRRFRQVMLGYRTIGHGFAQYEPDFRRVFHKQNRYGSAFVRPDWIIREIFRLPDVRLLGYVERAWNDHQDVVVFGRPGATGLGH